MNDSRVNGCRCIDADLGDCSGDLTERRTAGGETIVLCALHKASADAFWAGVVPALKALPELPVRKAS